MVYCDVLQWCHGQFYIQQYWHDLEGATHFRKPVDPRLKETWDNFPAWTITVRGPFLEEATSSKESQFTMKRCTKETTFMLCDLANVAAPEKVRELSFYSVDLLSPQLVGVLPNTFNKIECLHISYCREFTMQAAAKYSYPRFTEPNIELLYNWTVPYNEQIKNVDRAGSVIASLYMWRAIKPEPLMQNLINNTRFRTFIDAWTGSSGDDWYQSVLRAQREDDGADRKLLDTYNGQPLVTGSSALRMREPECRYCDLILPGLCYFKPRRNTGDTDGKCQACLLDEALFFRVGRGPFDGYNLSDLQNPTIKDIALSAMGIPPGTFPYLTPPSNVRFNSVCPFSLMEKQGKHPTGQQCTLRTAHVRSKAFRVDVQS
ncbi:hypothetical protein IMSHALPRED_007257 [Imshaugia aleurites]|uniref:Uncharacterized protein n=1 Tax=Imshaugia aleurites TaxID=172621 RepID=A0A8H3FTP8_9LECA|nr:hypothetical protein IMSHALPRED_007257 [Imshaugia aleurites]